MINHLLRQRFPWSGWTLTFVGQLCQCCLRPRAKDAPSRACRAEDSSPQLNQHLCAPNPVFDGVLLSSAALPPPWRLLLCRRMPRWRQQVEAIHHGRMPQTLQSTCFEECYHLQGPMEQHPWDHQEQLPSTFLIHPRRCFWWPRAMPISKHS